MERLTVLFDGSCGFCVWSADWLERASQAVPLDLVDCTSVDARERFAGIPWLGAELVVVAEDGRVWAGPAAFLITGWALSRYRWLAELAMTPLFLPLSLSLFDWVTAHRGSLGAWVGAPDCQGAHCLAKHDPVHAMLPAPYR